ncbi:hypothetical protein GCM10008942_03770 [Rhizomicrobium electricum]|uniref:IrrE N-terminal-like domain-containing protein n=1 Tax=Rhizomicrobium electricum TaxID=480070 RepID=A0ABP3P4I7_9PROT
MFRNNREIIVISEHIVPSSFSGEDESDVRYFIYVVLHEVAHAISNDKSKSEVSPEVYQGQEERADRLALKWFNAHIDEKRIPGLPRMTVEEIRQSQPISKRVQQITEI